jgi:hypothetical protein
LRTWETVLAVSRFSLKNAVVISNTAHTSLPVDLEPLAEPNPAVLASVFDLLIERGASSQGLTSPLPVVDSLNPVRYGGEKEDDAKPRTRPNYPPANPTPGSSLRPRVW